MVAAVGAIGGVMTVGKLMIGRLEAPKAGKVMLEHGAGQLEALVIQAVGTSLLR